MRETSRASYAREVEVEGTSNHGNNSPRMRPPEDWEETTNDESGGTYFINRKNWESSWVAPKGWKEVRE